MAEHRSDFYQHKHLNELKVFAGDRQPVFFGQKCDEESVGKAGGQTLLRLQLQNFTNDSYSYNVTFVWLYNAKLIIRLAD